MNTTLLILGIILVILFIILFYAKQITEKFEVDIIDPTCSTYINTTYGIDFTKGTAAQQTVVGDMLRAYTSTDTLDGSIQSDLGGCIFPSDILSQYNISSPTSATPCSWTDSNGASIIPNGSNLIPTGQNTSYSMVNPAGCMLQFDKSFIVPNTNSSSTFGNIIQTAFANKEAQYTSELNSINKSLSNVQGQTTILQNSYSSSNSLLNTVLGTNTSLQDQIDTITKNVSTQGQTLQKLNSEVSGTTANIAQNETTRIQTLNDSTYRLVQDALLTNKPILQKKINGAWYTLICKYTYGQTVATNFNNDPYLLYRATYGANINVDTLINYTPEVFIRDKVQQYRNDLVLNSQIGGANGLAGNAQIVLEVYNDTNYEPISSYEFLCPSTNNWDNWFSAQNLLGSGSATSVTGLIPDANNNNFWGGIAGDTNLRRRFFINKSYSGCPNDPGYLGIPTRSDIGCWDQIYNGKIITATDTYFNFGGTTPNVPNSVIQQYHLGTIMCMWVRKQVISTDPFQNLEATTGPLQLLQNVPYSVPSMASESESIMGRYIMLQASTTQCLNIAEIEVYSAPNTKNLALNAVISKSSGYLGDQYPIKNINDTNITNFAHTSCYDIPWIKIDLGSMQPIYNIRIFNRKDCCQWRIVGVVVSIMDAKQNIIYKSNPIADAKGNTAFSENGSLASLSFLTYDVYPPNTTVTGTNQPEYTYTETQSSGMWVSDKFTCPGAIGRNTTGNSGDFNNYCIFNNAQDAERQCNIDSACTGYVVTQDGKEAQLTRTQPISNGGTNAAFWKKNN